MMTVGLYMRLEAKPGMEDEVVEFLKDALQMARSEHDTTVFFACRMGPSTFAIFDAFTQEGARELHLAGPIAAALKVHGPELLAKPPVIEHLDVVGAKLPEGTWS